MFRRFKVLFIALLVIVLSGCSAEYDITIKKDLKLDEDITLLEDNNIIKIYAPNVQTFVANVVESSQDSGALSLEYKIENIIESDRSGGVASRSYATFNDFAQATRLKDHFYKELTMTDNGETVYLHFDSIDGQYNDFYGDDSDFEDSYSPFLTDMKLSIQVPFEVTSSNADEVDEKNNVYIWNYDKSSSGKDVELVFNKKQTFKWTVIDEVVNASEKVSFKYIGIIIGIVAALVIAVVLLIIKNAKNNRI